jgi:hypothetical protein
MVDDRMECRPMMCASNKWAGTIQDLLVDILMYDRLLERNGQMRMHNHLTVRVAEFRHRRNPHLTGDSIAASLPSAR